MSTQSSVDEFIANAIPGDSLAIQGRMIIESRKGDDLFLTRTDPQLGNTPVSGNPHRWDSKRQSLVNCDGDIPEWCLDQITFIGQRDMKSLQEKNEEGWGRRTPLTLSKEDFVEIFEGERGLVRVIDSAMKSAAFKHPAERMSFALERAGIPHDERDLAFILRIAEKIAPSWAQWLHYEGLREIPTTEEAITADPQTRVFSSH
ncbi:MAG: hypothetical protein AAB552_03210 [Patescibacteria group bacterium]